MSFPVTTSSGLRVTGLNYSTSTLFANGLFMGIWIKSASDYCRGLQLYSDGGSGGEPYANLGAYPATRSPWMSMRSGSGYDAIHTSSDYTDGSGMGNGLGWVFLWGKWNASTGDITAGFGDMTGTTVSGDTAWESYGNAVIKQIGVGVWRNVTNTGDEYSASISYKLAMPFIAKRLPTSGELTDLSNGVHPSDVFGSDLWDYWDVDSKTSAINSITLSDYNGTITINTDDNPPINAPTGGGGGGAGCLVICTDD